VGEGAQGRIAGGGGGGWLGRGRACAAAELAPKLAQVSTGRDAATEVVTGDAPALPPPLPRPPLPPRPPQLCHAEHLGEVSDLGAQPALLAVAAHFPARDRGTVRLIDNVVLQA
jgi:hypothetical protein